MDIISIVEENIAEEHICCAIGNDKDSRQREANKKAWLSDRFKEGLVFRRLDARGKVFIEYMPIETVWKPILGKNYLVINCLWVSGKYKKQGYAKQLLELCLEDAKKRGKDGVVVATSPKKKPFLTDGRFYQKYGFEVVDEAPPFFVLMAKKFNLDAPDPVFASHTKSGECENKDGFTLMYSDQCPYMEPYINLYAERIRELGMNAQVIKFESHTQAQSMGCPFGTSSLYYNGKFVTHELLAPKRLDAFLEQTIGIEIPESPTF